MIINMSDVLKDAYNKKYAVPHFNINNLEWTKYILEECQIMKSPVIIGVSESALKYMGGYSVPVNVVKSLVKDLNITIPVVIHLDHGSSIESCEKALIAGFTSVMIDASKYELNENIRITTAVKNIADKYNASVEAEIGCVGGSEDGHSSELTYASIDDCIEICNCVKIDALAPALGSMHGLYKSEPKLNFERMKIINDKIGIPLVLHGGTGIPNLQIKNAISCGTAKINVNTELQKSWADALREYLNNNLEVHDPRKIIPSGEKAIKEVVRDKIILFGSNDRYSTEV